jgi:hypothetical protein
MEVTYLRAQCETIGLLCARRVYIYWKYQRGDGRGKTERKALSLCRDKARQRLKASDAFDLFANQGQSQQHSHIALPLAPSRDAEGEVREEEKGVWDQMNIWVQSARTDHGSDSSQRSEIAKGRRLERDGVWMSHVELFG